MSAQVSVRFQQGSMSPMWQEVALVPSRACSDATVPHSRGSLAAGLGSQGSPEAVPEFPAKCVETS